jgi:hypothetical protein
MYARSMYTTTTIPPLKEDILVFKCELYGDSNFKTEDALRIPLEQSIEKLT